MERDQDVPHFVFTYCFTRIALSFRIQQDLANSCSSASFRLLLRTLPASDVRFPSYSLSVYASLSYMRVSMPPDAHDFYR